MLQNFCKRHEKAANATKNRGARKRCKIGARANIMEIGVPANATKTGVYTNATEIGVRADAT